MVRVLSDADLDEIERRAERAFQVLPRPWAPCLETREAIGGCSFIQAGDAEDIDREIFLDVHIGQQQLIPPSMEFDALVDFIGHAAKVVPLLLAEIRRLRGRTD